MIWSAFMGLPLSLAGVGAVFGLEEQKMKEGKDLIRNFCVPCKATKSGTSELMEVPLNVIDCHCFWKAVPVMQQFVSLALRFRM